MSSKCIFYNTFATLNIKCIRMSISKLVIIISTLSVVFNSCDPVVIDVYQCSSKTITYTSHIKTLMQSNCAISGCHDSKTRAKAIDLSTYALIKKEAVTQNFMGSINQELSYSSMPLRKNKLNQDSINVIYCWIKNGMPQ
jgi:hypothetical protein